MNISLSAAQMEPNAVIAPCSIKNALSSDQGLINRKCSYNIFIIWKAKNLAAAIRSSTTGIKKMHCFLYVRPIPLEQKPMHALLSNTSVKKTVLLPILMYGQVMGGASSTAIGHFKIPLF